MHGVSLSSSACTNFNKLPGPEVPKGFGTSDHFRTTRRGFLDVCDNRMVQR